MRQTTLWGCHITQNHGSSALHTFSTNEKIFNDRCIEK